VLRIEGINLGPAEGARASGMPLPTTISSPEVQVMLNNRAAPIFSVQPDHVVVQIPYDMPQGLAQVVVRRGEQRSRPATVQVIALLPSVKTNGGTGFGEAGVQEGSKLKLAVSGLGPTNPAVPSGDVPSGETTPRQPVRVYVGGLAAEASATLSAERVGEFDITVDIPQGAAPGDLISVYAAQASPANRPTFGRLRSPEVRYTPLPGGAQGVRVIRPSDLRGSYTVVHGPRSEDGCYPSWIAEAARREITRVDGCLIAAQANAVSPILAPGEQNILLSMVGPAVGGAAAGIANKVAIFNPARAVPLIVETPSAYSNLLSLPDGTVVGVQGAQPVFSVDSRTGEIGPPPQLPGPGGGGAGGGVGAIAAIQNLDLGDGIKEIIFGAGVGGGQQLFVVADSPSAPTKAKVAIVSNQGVPQTTADLPDGWLPAIRPIQQAPGGGVAGPGGGIIMAPGGAAGAGALQLRRGVGVISTGPNQALILVKKGGASAVLFLALPTLEARVAEMPSGWYVAGCTPQLNFQNFETTRQFALFGARSP
jgi:uncharacterized protein (TIGR03437 family)